MAFEDIPPVNKDNQKDFYKDPLADIKKLAAENQRLHDEKMNKIFDEKGLKRINPTNEEKPNRDMNKDIETLSSEDKEMFVDAVGKILEDSRKMRDIRSRRLTKEDEKELRTIKIEEARLMSFVTEQIKNAKNDSEVNELWKNYDFAFNSKNPTEGFEKIQRKNSILGTLVAMKICKDELGLELEPSKPEDDVDYQIDGWLRMRGKNGQETLIAVQLFSRTYGDIERIDQKFLKKEGIINIYDEEGIRKNSKRQNDTQFGVELENKINHTKKGVTKYTKDNRSDLKNKKFLLMFATIPVGSDANEEIVDKKGNCKTWIKDCFCEQFYNKFEENN
jgi:hypothetical protein